MATQGYHTGGVGAMAAENSSNARRFGRDTSVLLQYDHPNNLSAMKPGSQLCPNVPFTLVPWN